MNLLNLKLNLKFKSDAESDMIEYTDALGRTSVVERKELAKLREKDKEISDLNRTEYDEPKRSRILLKHCIVKYV